MALRDGSVECQEHGVQPATFVCRHLVQALRDGVPVGFFCAEDPDNPRPDAWCASCEKVVQSTGGEWNDESEREAGVTMICGECYDRVRQLCSG